MKYKNRRMSKKPRSDEIYIGHRDPYTGVWYDSDGKAKIQTLDGEWVAPDHVHTESGYQRESGKKKYTSFIFDAFVTDYLGHLRSFDIVFAIDTNTKTVNGTTVASTCVFQVLIVPISEEKIRVRYLGPWLHRFKNGKPGLDEKWSIVKLVNKLVNHISKNPDASTKTVAIITDHDLWHHEVYNDGSLALYKSFSLPKNFKLLYASSDLKNDNIMTFSIGQCDKAASDDLSFFERTGFFRFDIPVEQLMDVDNHR